MTSAQAATAAETWWRADISCRNPVTSCRFILEAGVAGVRTAYGRDLIQSGESVTLMADLPEVNISTWPRV